MVEHGDGWGHQPALPVTGGNYGFINVLHWYDYHRAAWDALPGYGPSFPICVTGGSSAGHFALLLAASRTSVDCVIAEAPPTKIDAPPGAGNVTPGLAPIAQFWANLAFGSPVGDTPPADVWSPQCQKYTLGKLQSVPIFIGHALNDELVNYSQSQAFCPLKTNCWVDYLHGETPVAGDPSTWDFTHANVNNADLALYTTRERKFACDVSRANQGGSSCP